VDPKTGKPVDATKPVGQWNHVKLVCDGPHIEHWMNGVKYCQYEIGSEDWNRRVAQSKFATWPGFTKNACGILRCRADHGDVCFAKHQASSARRQVTAPSLTEHGSPFSMLRAPLRTAYSPLVGLSVQVVVRVLHMPLATHNERMSCRERLVCGHYMLLPRALTTDC